MRNRLSQVLTCFVHKSDIAICNYSFNFNPELEKHPARLVLLGVNNMPNNSRVPGTTYFLSFKHDMD